MFLEIRWDKKNVEFLQVVLMGREVVFMVLYYYFEGCALEWKVSTLVGFDWNADAFLSWYRRNSILPPTPTKNNNKINQQNKKKGGKKGIPIKPTSIQKWNVTKGSWCFWKSTQFATTTDSCLPIARRPSRRSLQEICATAEWMKCTSCSRVDITYE